MCYLDFSPDNIGGNEDETQIEMKFENRKGYKYRWSGIQRGYAKTKAGSVPTVRGKGRAMDLAI